jgi:hypothetical protein
MIKINPQPTPLPKSLTETEEKIVDDVKRMFVEDSQKAIKYANANLHADVWDPLFSSLLEKRRMKKWEASLKPWQKKLNQWFPGKFEGSLLPPKPEDPKVIAERDRQKQLAYNLLTMTKGSRW